MRRATLGSSGPRTLDLDLILYGGLQVSAPDLELPHPRFRRRPFVLIPGVEVAPGLRDPVTGRTLLELSRSCNT